MNNISKKIKTFLSAMIFFCEHILKIIIFFMPVCTVSLACGAILKNDSCDDLWSMTFQVAVYMLILLLLFGYILNSFVAITNDGYDRITRFFLARNQTLFSYLTFGLFNTFLLQLYYSVKRPGTIGNFTELLLIFPLINIVVYIYFFHSLRERGFSFSFLKLTRLYLTGNLAAFLLKDEKYRFQ